MTMLPVRTTHESRLDISWRKFNTDESDPKIQDDRLGRRKFISSAAIHSNADEVSDGDAEGGNRRGGDSRNPVPGLRRSVSYVANYTSMEQPVFILCLSCLSSPVWTVHLRQILA
jgi:hypothetical protein